MSRVCRERYLELNAHAKSYTWKALVRDPNGDTHVFQVGGDRGLLRSSRAKWSTRRTGSVCADDPLLTDARWLMLTDTRR